MLPKTSFQLIPYTLPATSTPSSPIILRTTSSWSHAGPLLSHTSLPSGFHTWTKSTLTSGDLHALLVPFLDFLNTWMPEHHLTHYLLTIRAQKATPEFDCPRWHIDRRAFQPASLSSISLRLKPTREKRKRESYDEIAEPSVWKVATVLQGPGTLFLADSKRGVALQTSIEKSLREDHVQDPGGEKHECRTLRCAGCAETASSVRFKLAAAVAAEGLEVVRMEKGEIAVFRAEGDRGLGAMHSEPCIKGDRVFVHVIPGTESEVEGLVRSWGMEFPRDWSVGGVVNWGV